MSPIGTSSRNSPASPGERPASPGESPASSSENPASERDSARLLLFERLGRGFAHEGKSPLHTMVLHLQLLSEKLRSPGAGPAAGNLERHLHALRDGIGRVDEILRAFSDFAAPAPDPQPDLGHAITRALLLFAFEVRRASVEVAREGPASLRASVQGDDPAAPGDLISHAILAAVALAWGGGRLRIELAPEDSQLRIALRTDGGTPHLAEAAPHLEALRALAARASAELQLDVPDADSSRAISGARISLLFRRGGESNPDGR